MKIVNLIKKNAKLFIIMSIIIILGIIGVTFALNIDAFNPIDVNTTAGDIKAEITYDEGTNGSEIINNGNLLPISDNLVTFDTTDSRVLKVKFNVSGVDSNPDNTIYDVVLRDIDIDCVLRTTELKWRLYKNDLLLSEGNLSPTFDIMKDNRLVLTNIQQDLSVNSDKYTFMLWISEACTNGISQCDQSMDQSKYLNKTLSASIKIELSTKGKKEIDRITSNEDVCNYIEVDIPICNSVSYDGTNQVLVAPNEAYTLINNNGIDIGSYNVVLSLNEGYKWKDGSTDDKFITCYIVNE